MLKNPANSLSVVKRRERLQALGICGICGFNSLEYKKLRCIECKNRATKLTTLRNEWHRLNIIYAYGGVCGCCGEDNPFFLTIDHVNNDGRLEKSRSSFYARTLKNGCPDNLRILCWNCNCARHYRSDTGECPHVNQYCNTESSRIQQAQ